MLVDGERLKKEMSRWKCPPHFGKVYYGSFENGDLDKIIESCKLDIQPPAKIEAAIRYFREQFDKRERAPYDERYKITSAFGTLVVADLLRWVLRQPQDTWTDKDFGLDKETTRSDEGT